MSQTYENSPPQWLYATAGVMFIGCDIAVSVYDDFIDEDETWLALTAGIP